MTAGNFVLAGREGRVESNVMCIDVGDVEGVGRCGLEFRGNVYYSGVEWSETVKTQLCLVRIDIDSPSVEVGDKVLQYLLKTVNK